MLGRVAVVELKSSSVKRNGILFSSDILNDHGFLFSLEISLSFSGNRIGINILVSTDATLRFDNVEKASGGRGRRRDHCRRQDEFQVETVSQACLLTECMCLALLLIEQFGSIRHT